MMPVVEFRVILGGKIVGYEKLGDDGCWRYKIDEQEHWHKNHFEIIGTTRQQFTGFYDTRGQKVYVGDIVFDESVHEDERRFWPITQELGGYLVNFDDLLWDYAIWRKNDKGHMTNPTNQLEHLVVEGNILDNAYLLDDWQFKKLKETQHYAKN